MSDTFSLIKNKICENKNKEFLVLLGGEHGVSEGFLYFSNCCACGIIKKFKVKLELDLSI